MNDLVVDRQKLGLELRAVVVNTLKDMMTTDERIIALEADLGAASSFNQFNSQQCVNVGIAEANMIGVASGLSLAGFIPYTHSFAPFTTRRVFDQLFVSCGYQDIHINLFGSDPGFNVAINGGTHCSFEDIALIRMIPQSVICDAADEVQLTYILQAFAERKGVNYVRATRKPVRQVYKPNTLFNIGQGKVLKEGTKITLITCGQLVSDVLDVAEQLEIQGIDVTVVDMFTIKPIDKQLVLQLAKISDQMITIENHSIYGGLGSSVAEIISESSYCTQLTRIGINEQFGQVGSVEYLQKYFKLDSEQLLSQILDIIKKNE